MKLDSWGDKTFKEQMKVYDKLFRAAVWTEHNTAFWTTSVSGSELEYWPITWVWRHEGKKFSGDPRALLKYIKDKKAS